MLKEEAKNCKTKVYGDGTLLSKSSKKKAGIPQSSSQLFTIQESVDQINSPNQTTQAAMAFGFGGQASAKQGHDPRFDSPIHMQMPAGGFNPSSPQPCVSPSSLINIMNDSETQTAPVVNNLQGDFSSNSKSNMSASGYISGSNANKL